MYLCGIFKSKDSSGCSFPSWFLRALTNSPNAFIENVSISFDIVSVLTILGEKNDQSGSLWQIYHGMSTLTENSSPQRLCLSCRESSWANAVISSHALVKTHSERRSQALFQLRNFSRNPRRLFRILSLNKNNNLSPTSRGCPCHCDFLIYSWLSIEEQLIFLLYFQGCIHVIGIFKAMLWDFVSLFTQPVSYLLV